jgi:hypothetical protein
VDGDWADFLRGAAQLRRDGGGVKSILDLCIHITNTAVLCKLTLIKFHFIFGSVLFHNWGLNPSPHTFQAGPPNLTFLNGNQR